MEKLIKHQDKVGDVGMQTNLTGEFAIVAVPAEQLVGMPLVEDAVVGGAVQNPESGTVLLVVFEAAAHTNRGSPVGVFDREYVQRASYVHAAQSAHGGVALTPRSTVSSYPVTAAAVAALHRQVG